MPDHKARCYSINSDSNNGVYGIPEPVRRVPPASELREWAERDDDEWEPMIPSYGLVLYDTWIYTRTHVPRLVGSDAGKRATCRP
jgi:hypothetical protein